MCDRAGARRPRWLALYAIVAAVAVASLLDLALFAGVARTAVAVAVAVLAAAALYRWIRSNAVALDQIEWCACASGTVRVRVIDASRAAVDEPASLVSAGR